MKFPRELDDDKPTPGDIIREVFSSALQKNAEEPPTLPELGEEVNAPVEIESEVVFVNEPDLDMSPINTMIGERSDIPADARTALEDLRAEVASLIDTRHTLTAMILQTSQMSRVSSEKLNAVLELHSPNHPPNGSTFMGSSDERPKCAGCDCGDPYLTQDWPCDTVRLINEFNEVKED